MTDPRWSGGILDGDLPWDELDLQGLHALDDSPTWSQREAADVIKELAIHWMQRPYFVDCRLQELFDGVRLEHDDEYVLAMISALGSRTRAGIREFMLRHDHQLRDEVFWRIFEVEGGGEVSLTNVDKFSREEAGWKATVLTLVADGTLDRARVLRCCLQALNRDFSAYRAGWFSRMFTALQPTTAEITANADLLVALLSSPISATVSLAVKNSVVLHQAGALDADGFLTGALVPLLGPKTVALPTVRLARALGHEPQHCEAAAEALIGGLASTNPDVQRAIVAAVNDIGRGDLLPEAADLMAPEVAAELGLLRVEKVVVELPELESPTPVEPITAKDAVERVAAFLEDPLDAVEFELIAAYLAAEPSAGQVLAPLLKRAKTLVRRDWEHLAAWLVLLAIDAKAAEQTELGRWRGHRDWVVGDVPVSSSDDTELGWYALLLARVGEVADILRGEAPNRVLLATPTLSDGSIDTGALRDRLRPESALASDGTLTSPYPADLTQACLRVADPDAIAAVLGAGVPRAPLGVTINDEWQVTTRHARRDYPSNTAPKLPRYADPPQLAFAQLAIMTPGNTAYLVAGGLWRVWACWDGDYRGERVLEALPKVTGWTSETAQIVALGMAADHPSFRALAVDALIRGVPARLSAAEAARGFAAQAHLVILNRWKTGFTDAASVNPSMVVDLLTALEPHLNRGLRTLLRNERLRLGVQA